MDNESNRVPADVVSIAMRCVRRNPSTGSVTTSASESGSLERARAQLERRKRAGLAHAHAAPPPLSQLPPDAGDGHVGSCRVENTRVNPDSLIDEIIASTDLKKAVEDNAESQYALLTKKRRTVA